MKTRVLVLGALVCASTLFAAVSPEKAAWGKGPIQYLMTKEEQSAWNALAADADADAFVTAFWARRDPTPGTAANELRDEFDRRVAYADANFPNRGVKGSMTERGRIYVIFGTPTRVTPGRTVTDIPRQVWTYEGAITNRIFGRDAVEIAFIDRLNSRDYRLDSPQSVDLDTAHQRVIAAWIPTAMPKPQPPPAPVAATSPTAFKTASLEAAIADAKGGRIAAKGATVSFAEFISPAGEYYIPVALYVPASASVTTDAVDTFFGIIEDAEGKRVQAFEVMAKPTASRNSLLYDTTLNLPDGKYTATLGVAKGGVPVLVSTGPLEVKAIAKDAVGTSKLILSDVMETLEAAPVKSPYAFGKLKIVPRTVFSNKDELGYFIELHNPGIDPGTNLPKLQTKVDLLRPTGPPISAPLMDAQALPLSGAVGPGEYAIISGIPLGDLSKPLPAGDYSLRIKVVDTITKQSYTVEQKFKIAG
jgi:GWxTD domain-containing protein